MSRPSRPPRNLSSEQAAYAIHVAGRVGPMLVSSVLRAGSSTGGPTAVHTRGSSLVLVATTDDDLVEVVRRLVDSGVEVARVRELVASRDAVADVAAQIERAGSG